MSGRIIVHSLDHARIAVAAAAALGGGVTLVSAPGAGVYAGPLWFRAVVDEAAAGFPGIAVAAEIDCGTEAGSVLAALRTGFRRVVFTGPEATRTRLAGIAAAQGAVILPRAVGLLDLLEVRDPAAACRAYLAGPGVG